MIRYNNISRPAHHHPYNRCDTHDPSAQTLGVATTSTPRIDAPGGVVLYSKLWYYSWCCIPWLQSVMSSGRRLRRAMLDMQVSLMSFKVQTNVNRDVYNG